MGLEQIAIDRLRMASDLSLHLHEQPLVITYRAARTRTCFCIWRAKPVSSMRFCTR